MNKTTPTNKQPETTETEATYTASVTNDGVQWTPTETPAVETISKQTVSEAPKQSPFTLDEIENMRRFPVVAEQFQRMRTKELLEHHKFCRGRRAEIERALGVTAEQIFRRGDSAAAAKLQRENPEGYRLLRELSHYL